MKYVLSSLILLTFFNIILCNFFGLLDILPAKKDEIPEDGKLNFTGLSIKYGKPAEEYQVITEDGYILTMYHIKGHLGPVLLEHGLAESSDTFIVRGNNSLAIALAEAGYDLWFGNARGNKYSRKHLTLDPDIDKEFWDYSLHEMGFYDIAAMIDFVLEHTGKTKLMAIGHSQGNGVFYVLGATRPEYNDKIEVLIALAPICYLHHSKGSVRALIELGPEISDLLVALGQEELLNDHSALDFLIKIICTETPFRYEICSTGFYSIAGTDPDQLGKDFLDVIIRHFPTEISRTNALHLSQIGRTKKYKQFDYGIERNLVEYGQEVPPEYDLSKVTMEVELFTGANDYLATVEDVKILWKKLPNARYKLLEYKKMNHFDFVWGKNADKYLYPHIFEVLKKHSEKCLNE